MNYLVVFRLDGFKTATNFATKKDATAFIKECAEAVKSKALKNSESDEYIIEIKSGGDSVELKANIESIDAKIKYELSYDKNDEHIETSYYETRKAAVAAAKKILDELGYDASAEENNVGSWSISNAEQNLSARLKAKLVLVGSDQDNVVESYNCIDMKNFCKNFDTEYAKIQTAKKVVKNGIVKDARKKGFTNLGIGLGIAALGGILSLVSYNTAKPGETYTVYTGLIVVGIIDALCGVYYLVNPKAALPKDQRKNK